MIDNSSYHKKLLSQSNIIKAYVISYTLHPDLSDSMFCYHYTVYKIQLVTHFRNWIIYKRYTDFFEFHDILAKLNIGPLPELPPKRWWKLSQSTLNERKENLQIYLNSLLYHFNIEYIEPLLNFIQIDKNVFEIYFKCNQLTKNKCDTSNQSIKANLTLAQTIDSDHINFYDSLRQFKLYEDEDVDENKESKEVKSVNGFVIEEFLCNLHENIDNMINIISAFEAFLNNGQHIVCLTIKDIKTLFFGIKSNEKTYLKGILYHCGNIEGNQLGAQYCLKFIQRLLNYESNLHYEKYVDVLRENKEIISMRLTSHLMSNSLQINNIAFEILFILTNDRDDDSLIDQLINNKTIKERYEQWKSMKY